MAKKEVNPNANPNAGAVHGPTKLTVEFDEAGGAPKLVAQLPDGTCYFAALEPLTA